MKSFLFVNKWYNKKGDSMKVILRIGGMSCSACSTGLEKYLNKQKGIVNASVNLVLAQAMIEYDESVTLKDINRFIKEAGFESLGEYSTKEDENKSHKVEFIVFSILAILLMYVSMGEMIHLPVIPLLNMNNHPIIYGVSLILLTVPFLYYGKDILSSGFKKLIHRVPNMDTLVSIGVISSFLFSIFSFIMICFKREEYVHSLYFESSAIVIYFIKLGRFIDTKSKNKTKEAIKELVQITPESALVLENGKEVVKTIDEVKVKDILVAKPGMKIAVDGFIVKGSTHVDESFITGESIPSKKIEKDRVVAGSINVDGYIEYEAEKIGKDSTISSIVRLVLEASNTKAPIARVADIVSGYFVPSIMIIALLTFISYLVFGNGISEALVHFVTVLVVACPCALGLATSLAIVVGSGTCAKNGILVKSSEVLENVSKVDTVVFDKTGTLTYGNLKISKVYNYSDYNDDELIGIVSSIENKSSHPISKAFLAHFEENERELVSVDEFENIPGIGLKSKINDKLYYVGSAKLLNKLKIENIHKEDEDELELNGNSIVYVIENNKVIGLIGVNDIVRSDVVNVINELKRRNKEVIMLTGDNQKSARLIANSIGIEHVIASVMPVDKTNKIKELVSNNKIVMMVGDGINDAPALTSASVGVSMHGGTDIAMDSSDVILMNDKLENIISLIDMSNRTLRNIKQNLFWAFFYNMIMIPVAIGLFERWNVSMNPMWGSLAMTLSSLTVIFNALRLKKWR